MKDKLLKLMDNAYCPYSKFPVSCVVVTKDLKEFLEKDLNLIQHQN